MFKTWRILFVAILVATVAACGGGGTNGGGGGGGGGGRGGSGPWGDEGGAVSGDGSSTTAGNPSVMITIKDATALMIQDKQGANFMKIVEGQIEPALVARGGSSGNSWSGGGSNISASIQSDYYDESYEPRVRSFYQGPNGELVILFDDPIYFGEYDEYSDNSCYFVYYNPDSDSTLCIEPDSSIDDDNIEFDSAGNVYYSNWSLIKKWNPQDQTTTTLTNQNMSINNWLVHANGSIMMSGSSSGLNFFRKVTPGQPIQNYLDGNASVYDFRFVDKNHLLLEGESVQAGGEEMSGLMLLGIDGEDNNIIEETDAFGNPSGYLRASDGYYYTGSTSEIWSVYPGVPRKLYMDASGIGTFRIVDQNLYATGQRGLKHVLLLAHLNENERAVDVLGDYDIEIYDFVIVNEYIYFNGLNMADGEIVIGEIDLNTHAINFLESIDKKLLQFEPRRYNQNESFLDIDDLRDMIEPAFASETTLFSEFEGLGKIRATAELTGDYEGYVAVIAGSNLYVYDMNGPDGQPVLWKNSVPVLTAGWVPGGYGIVQEGDRLYVIANISNMTIYCISLPTMNLQTNSKWIYTWSGFDVYSNLVATNYYTFNLWNYSSPSSPVEISSVTNDSGAFSAGASLAVHDFSNVDYVNFIEADDLLVIHSQYSDTSKKGFFLFDVANVDDIRLTGYIPYAGSVNAGNADNPMEFVGSSYERMTVLEIDPIGENVVGLFDKCTVYLYIRQWFGDNAFAISEDTVYIMDMSNVENPQIVQKITHEEGIESISVSESGDGYTLYIGDSEDLHIIRLTQ